MKRNVRGKNDWSNEKFSAGWSSFHSFLMGGRHDGLRRSFVSPALMGAGFRDGESWCFFWLAGNIEGM